MVRSGPAARDRYLMTANHSARSDGAIAIETRVELARLLQRQLPVVFAVNAVNALLVAAVLAPVRGLASWQWAGLVLSVTAVRALIWRRQRHRSIRAENADVISAVQIGGS